MQTIKHLSENNCNSGKNMHLRFTIPSSFFDESNYWTSGDFQKNKDDDDDEVYF